jgi:hypothetical protein
LIDLGTNGPAVAAAVNPVAAGKSVGTQKKTRPQLPEAIEKNYMTLFLMYFTRRSAKRRRRLAR